MCQTSKMMGVGRQRGFGMMGFAAGVLAVMALAGVVYVATSSSGRLQIATDQHDALANADRLRAICTGEWAVPVPVDLGQWC